MGPPVQPTQQKALAGGEPLVLGGNVYLGDYLLGRHDLIGAHSQQNPLGGEHAILGQQVQNGVFCKEGLAEIHQVGYRHIVRIRPPTRELETVAGALALGGLVRQFLDMCKACGIAVVLEVKTRWRTLF